MRYNLIKIWNILNNENIKTKLIKAFKLRNYWLSKVKSTKMKNCYNQWGNKSSKLINKKWKNIIKKSHKQKCK